MCHQAFPRGGPAGVDPVLRQIRYHFFLDWSGVDQPAPDYVNETFPKAGQAHMGPSYATEEAFLYLKMRIWYYFLGEH